MVFVRPRIIFIFTLIFFTEFSLKSVIATAATVVTNDPQTQTQKPLISFFQLLGSVTQVAGISGTRFTNGYSGNFSIGVNLFELPPELTPYLYGNFTYLKVRNLSGGEFFLAQLGAGLEMQSQTGTWNTFFPVFSIQLGTVYNWLGYPNGGATQMNSAFYPAIGFTPGIHIRVSNSIDIPLLMQIQYVLTQPKPLTLFLPSTGVRIRL